MAGNETPARQSERTAQRLLLAVLEDYRGAPGGPSRIARLGRTCQRSKVW